MLGNRFALRGGLCRNGVALALVMGVFVIAWSPTADGDIWWHLAAGREMVRTMGLLHTDPFSVSAGGRPWPDVHWLFQLGCFALYQAGGLFALVLAKCSLTAFGAWLLLRSTRTRLGDHGSAAFGLTFLGVLFGVQQLLLVRPIVLTLVLLAWYFLVLESSRRRPNTALLWSLPFAQALWANVQGLSAFGPALVGAYAAAEVLSARYAGRPGYPFAREAHGAARPVRGRTLIFAWIACCLGGLATPFGWNQVKLPLTLLARLSKAGNPTSGDAVFALQVAENVPPFAVPANEFWHLKWFLLGLGVALVLPMRRLLLSHALVLSALIVLALMANRNVLLLYWLAPAIAHLHIAPLVRAWLHRQRTHRARSVLRWVEGSAFASVLLLVGTVAAREPSIGEPAPFRTPIESAARIAAEPGDAPVFSADHYGGYLIWALAPRHRPYMDTRLVLRTADEYTEFLGLLSEPTRFDAFAEHHAFGYVVLPTAYPDRYLALASYLSNSTAWKLVYTDGSETLFARSASPAPAWDLSARTTTQRILELLQQRFAAQPALHDAARLQLGTLQIAVGSFDEADYVLLRTGTQEALALAARGRLIRGDLAGAEALGRRLLREDADQVRSLSVLALASLARGDSVQGKELLLSLIRQNPLDSETENLVRRLEKQQ